MQAHTDDMTRLRHSSAALQLLLVPLTVLGLLGMHQLAGAPPAQASSHHASSHGESYPHASTTCPDTPRAHSFTCGVWVCIAQPEPDAQAPTRTSGSVTPRTMSGMSGEPHGFRADASTSRPPPDRLLLSVCRT